MVYGQQKVQHDISLDLLDLMNNIQFVDVKLVGFDLINHKIKVPERLLEVAEIADEHRKSTTSYNLFNSSDDIVLNAREISRMVEKLRKKYTVSAGPYGRIIILEQKQEFEEELESINIKIDSFIKYNSYYVIYAFERTIEEIYNYLLPFILRSENKTMFKDKDDIFDYVDKLIRRDLDNIKNYFLFAGLSVIYSNVAIENLYDDRFRALLYRNKNINKVLMNTSIYKKLQDEGFYLETLNINSWRGDWFHSLLGLDHI